MKNFIDEDADIILVTSAQSKTAINSSQFKSMKRYAKFLTKTYNKKVEIVVLPLRYRNPTSPTEDISKTKTEFYDDEVLPYLYYNKIKFGDAIISGDSHINATAKEPLNGFDSIQGDNHLILPSPRIHFKTQPRYRNEALRAMLTCGTITNKNYSRSRAGDNGEAHHTYGFAIIEKKDDGVCHIPRNIYIDGDGGFIDLIHNVTPKEVTINNTCKSITWGDIHAKLLDETIYKETKKLCNLIKPDTHILHDVLDGSTFNPHERKDTFIMRRKILRGEHLIKEEVDQAIKFPKRVLKECGGGGTVHVVESNHDVFLDRHINDMDWKKDLHNSDAYLKYAKIQQTIDLEKYGNIYGYLLTKKYKNDKIKYLKYGSSFKIANFELAAHGDCGVNGSRGNIRQFKRLNTKMIHGHNHSPIIMDGVTSVGLTAILEQYYTRRGMSTHANAHSLIHNNGKRQLLVFGDDKKISEFI